jgi:hypothetical protein
MNSVDVLEAWISSNTSEWEVCGASRSGILIFWNATSNQQPVSIWHMNLHHSVSLTVSATNEYHCVLLVSLQ